MFLWQTLKLFYVHTQNLKLKNLLQYVLHLLYDYYYASIVSFDLGRSKGAHDVFVSVLNFWGFDRKLKHVTLSLFEVTNITK
jgi:hypothetical protein